MTQTILAGIAGAGRRAHEEITSTRCKFMIATGSGDPSQDDIRRGGKDGG